MDHLRHHHRLFHWMALEAVHLIDLQTAFEAQQRSGGAPSLSWAAEQQVRVRMQSCNENPAHRWPGGDGAAARHAAVHRGAVL